MPQQQLIYLLIDLPISKGMEISKWVDEHDAELDKQIQALTKERDGLREALKEIDQLCDNQNASHEQIWRTVFKVLNPKV